MQQEEIARLRRNTKKIREKAVSHQGGQGDKIEEDVKGEQVKVSDAEKDKDSKRILSISERKQNSRKDNFGVFETGNSWLVYRDAPIKLEILISVTHIIFMNFLFPR